MTSSLLYDYFGRRSTEELRNRIESDGAASMRLRVSDLGLLSTGVRKYGQVLWMKNLMCFIAFSSLQHPNM